MNGQFTSAIFGSAHQQVIAVRSHKPVMVPGFVRTPTVPSIGTQLTALAVSLNQR